MVRIPAALAALALLVPASAAALTIPSVMDDDGKILKEPASHSMPQRYLAKCSAETKHVPVAFTGPDASLYTTVTSCSALGTTSVSGSYGGRAIIAREFGKFLSANFSAPQPDERPVARLVVKVDETSDVNSYWSGVSSTISLTVDFMRCEGGDGKISFSVKKTVKDVKWPDRDSIPPSFYSALSAAIDSFMVEWESGDGPAAVAGWCEPSAAGKPPELKKLKWISRRDGDDVHFGECSVSCNGYEPFRAKKWANAQLAAVARTKLGNIEHERVRILYDAEDFDPNTALWTFGFRVFARSRTVFSFDKTTRRGSITGDLELMGNKDECAASEELKAIVLKETGWYAGLVEKGEPVPESRVRFDAYKMDGAFGLITITFRML